MLKGFFNRLSWAFLIFILMVILITGLISKTTLKNYYLNNVETNLAYEATLVANMLTLTQANAGDAQTVQSICLEAAQDTDTRATIVDSTGKVLGDSHFDPRTLENHIGRPEIYQALHGQRGISIRLSDTSKLDTLYVAIPFNNGIFNGAVRLAKPVDQAEALYNEILLAILMSILLVGSGAFMLSLAITARFTRPIKHISGVVNEIAQGDLDQRITLNVENELGTLTAAINSMAANLQQNLAEISQIKNRLEAVLDNTVNGILMVDHEGHLTYANPVAENLLGINTSAQGRKHVEIITNYKLVEFIDKIRQNGQILRQELVLHALGEKTLEANGVPVYKQDKNDWPDVLIILNDITELKRLQRVRQDFVANISHELKTPVATISGFAETLMGEGMENSETVQEFSQIIYDEAQRLSKMIKALLELSRIESGFQEMHLKKVQMIDIIKNAVSIVKKLDNSINILVEIEPEAYNQSLEADQELVIQILINLLENALNHSPENAKIIVRMENIGSSLKISVIDQGEGIPEIDLPRIFERFYRVDKARSRKTGGTGLGLAIVKHLVENHGGEVGVESRVGEGSVFFFTLPKES